MSRAPAELIYWNGRGRAHIIRLMLAAGGVEFVEPYYITDKTQLPKLRADGHLFFQQLPLLKWDGKKMVQAGAIVRHIARKCGLYGSNVDEQYEIDLLYEGTRDFVGPFQGWHFQPPEQCLKSLKEKTLPRYLPIFEKAIGDKQYLVGNKLSLADVGLLECLIYLEDVAKEEYSKAPKLKAYLQRLRQEPKLAKFLSGPQNKPMPDAAYVQTVLATL